jgi:hypothetical protein
LLLEVQRMQRRERITANSRPASKLQMNKPIAKTKHVCLGLLSLMTAYELMLFTRSSIAEHKAEKIAELVATLKPGYTKEDSARVLFQAHGFNVRTLNNACVDL